MSIDVTMSARSHELAKRADGCEAAVPFPTGSSGRSPSSRRGAERAHRRTWSRACSERSEEVGRGARCRGRRQLRAGGHCLHDRGRPLDGRRGRGRGSRGWPGVLADLRPAGGSAGGAAERGHQALPSLARCGRGRGAGGRHPSSISRRRCSGTPWACCSAASTSRSCGCASRSSQSAHRADEELTRRQEELAFLATHDALTGLPNRTLILDRVEQMLVRSRRNPATVAVLSIDLDNFKGINETLGRAPATSCCVRLPRGSRESSATSTRSGVSAGTSSWWSLRTRRWRRVPSRSPSICSTRSSSRSSWTGPTRVARRLRRASGSQRGTGRSAEELLRDADIAMYRAKLAGKQPLRGVRAGDAGRGPDPDGAQDEPGRRASRTRSSSWSISRRSTCGP